MLKDSRSTDDLRRSVADVYAVELDYLVERRRRLGDKDVDASTLQAERQRAGTAIPPRVAHGTIGLALSGGGIRSATFPILAAVIPAAVIGYLKRSLWIFGFAAAGLLAAVELVHFGEWLSREHYAVLVEWYPRFLVIAGVSGFAINVNKVSLLNFYRDRLADAYMIRRSPGQITTSDRIRLRDVLPTSNGPYHLLNATLNLAGSRDLSLRGRRSAHFLFSKLYCGSPRVGYAPTSAYARGRLDLPTAMAVSGAAVSPQMGSATKPGLAVLMALLNVRLGQWLPNPAVRLRAGLVFWNYFFVKELFSLTDENDWYVFVSDGGHFDNTGLYGLLERRCRTIIAVDCGADPDRKFDDVANIMRKARIDFGIEIQLDLGKLHGDPTTQRAAAGFQVGRILYPPNQGDVAGEGRIVYIKPTMSADFHESEDLLEYARTIRPSPRRRPPINSSTRGSSSPTASSATSSPRPASPRSGPAGSADARRAAPRCSSGRPQYSSRPSRWRASVRRS